MALKNFSLAFQIGAVFHGNKAFTDAVIKTKELSQTMKECSKQMKMVDDAYDKGVLGLASKINAQLKIGKVYADKMGDKGLYEKLAQAQNKFESSYGSMTKYGANTFQFAEMAKGVMSMSSAAADFETKISKVQAITGGTTDDMKLLEKTALDLGKKTRFSASESAEAMSYLGMAGWKTNQIVSAMPGLLDLAAASGQDLASVADIISDDLTAFGMKAEDAGKMADVFAAASSNANTNVALMGETFKYAGAVAGAMGYKLEDVAVATGLMANAGINDGYIVGSFYSEVDAPKESDETVKSIRFKDGSYVRYGGQGNIKINAVGSVDIIAGGNITINGARIDLN